MKYLLVILLIQSYLMAGPTKVGNGDDGEDLEGFELIQDGKIISTRKKAIALLERLNIRGIEYLGGLIAEVENTKMYLTKRNISASKMQELGAFHADTNKNIYARTFARPYAATRFFPVALELSEDQLVALHIHEGLHRSLPEEFREDEQVVSAVTLAIVTPMTTHDQVKDAVEQNIKMYTGSFKGKNRKHKSSLKLEQSVYDQDFSEIEYFSTLKTWTHLEQRIFPFRGKLQALGLGVDLNYVSTLNESFISTVGLFLNYDLYTINGFDISIDGLWNRDSGNGNSYKSSVMGRDSFRGGINFEKEENQLQQKHRLEFLMEKRFVKIYDEGEVTHKFGSRTGIISQWLKMKQNFSFGLEFNLYLFGHSSHQFNSQSTGTNRTTISNLGPMMLWQLDDFQVYMKVLKNIARDGESSELNLHDQESEGRAQDSLTIGIYKGF